MILLIIAALFIAAAVYLLFYQLKSAKKEAAAGAHLPEYVLKDDMAPDLPLSEEREFEASRRAWTPLTSKFKAPAQKIQAKSLRRRLLKAGSPMGVLEFFAFKALSLLSIPAAAFIFLGGAFTNKIMLFLVSLAIGYFLPEIWLNKIIKKRQNNIRKELPNIIDLLNLCVSGGMDFMLAVNRVIRDLRPSDLTVELAEVYRQTQMGKARKDALKDFAWRIDSPDVSSFVRTLIQADRMGTPMGEAMKLQAEEMRVRRFQRGEAMALKAPIKLLFPLFVFILPVVLILVAGPILLEFTKTGIGF